MNNSRVAYKTEENVDRTSFLQQQQGELAQVVEAIKAVESNEDWKKLKRLLLDGVVTTLERKLSGEAAKAEVNTPELYRLQGQLAWARRYCDLKKLAEVFKNQMDSISSQLKNNN